MDKREKREMEKEKGFPFSRSATRAQSDYDELTTGSDDNPLRRRGRRRCGRGAVGMSEMRTLKRRAGVAEEALRIKKERLDEAEQEYEEEHTGPSRCLLAAA